MIAARVRLEQQAGLFRAEVSAELFAHALMGIIERFVRHAPGQESSTLSGFISDLLLDGARRRARRRRACPPDAAPALTDP